LKPGEHTLTIRIDAREREYILYVPPAADRQRIPLVFVLHGGGGTARLAALATGWSQKAKAVGFLVVYPQAVRPNPQRPPTFLRNPPFWNVGSGVGHGEHEGVDDVAFIRALLDELSQRLPIDPRRVYAAGFSNGAGLTFRLGMELSEHFAAIAPVSGNRWRAGPAPSRPVSMIYISGTADPMNPLNGAPIESPWGHVLHPMPIMETIRAWAAWTGCPPEPRVLRDDDGVHRVRFGPGRQGAEVDFITIEGAGHAWPGGPSVLTERLAGTPTDKLNATDVIWEFFARHPQPRDGH
jgi:polyhydroxybutyrate depolymerase